MMRSISQILFNVLNDRSNHTVNHLPFFIKFKLEQDFRDNVACFVTPYSFNVYTVDQMLQRDHSLESYRTVLSRRAACFVTPYSLTFTPWL